MLILATKTSKKSFFKSLRDRGFTLVEVLVALLLVSLVLLVWKNTGDETHQELISTVESVERSLQFAANESILRNSVVRLRLSLEKSPIEYTVEYGPAGNFPLPDFQEGSVKSIATEEAEKAKLSNLDKQFTKVEEFEDVKVELSDEVTVLGIGSSSMKKLITANDASVYFYPTGEKDAALIFFATTSEIAWIEVQPFLSTTRTTFETIDTKRVAKIEDILQSKMDEVYKQWVGK